MELMDVWFNLVLGAMVFIVAPLLIAWTVYDAYQSGGVGSGLLVLLLFVVVLTPLYYKLVKVWR